MQAKSLKIEKASHEHLADQVSLRQEHNLVIQSGRLASTTRITDTKKENGNG